jgi:hypothetical protein
VGGHAATSSIDPDAPVAELPIGGRVGRAPCRRVRPLGVGLCLARLAAVSDEATQDGGGAAESDLDATRAEVEEALAESRQRLAEVPAEVVVVNHAMGLYELGAIHLSNQPPALDQAALAIDAFACLIEGLDERLGPNIDVLRDALSQIRLAFVQIKGATGESQDSAGEPPAE